MNEKLTQLFKTKPTQCELLSLNTLVVHFGDVIVKAHFEEKGCCLGKYCKFSLDCEVSENGGKDYTAYRSYPLIESLKNNKDIPINQLVKEYNQ